MSYMTIVYGNLDASRMKIFFRIRGIKHKTKDTENCRMIIRKMLQYSDSIREVIVDVDLNRFTIVQPFIMKGMYMQ